MTSTSASQSGLSCGTSYPFGVRRPRRRRTHIGRGAAHRLHGRLLDDAAADDRHDLAIDADGSRCLEHRADGPGAELERVERQRRGHGLRRLPQRGEGGIGDQHERQPEQASPAERPIRSQCAPSTRAGRTSAAAQLTVSTAACSRRLRRPTRRRHRRRRVLESRAPRHGRASRSRWNRIDRQRRCRRLPAVCQWSPPSVTTTQPGTTVSNLSCGTAYTFAVDAYDAAGNHSPQASVTGSTAACADTQAPTAPTNVVADLADCNEHRPVLVGLQRQRRRRRLRPLSRRLAGGLDHRRRPGSSPASRATRTTRSRSTPTTPPATTRRRRWSWSRRPPARTRRRRRPRPASRASNVSQTGLTLGWNASTDNVGVTGYDVYRNGTKMATVTSTSSSQTGLACGTTYTFGVVARDAAGNSSSQGQLTASTTACSAPPPAHRRLCHLFVRAFVVRGRQLDAGSNNGHRGPNAWRGFGNIAWGSIVGGDCLYISGGSTSKTYTTPLTVGAAGSSDSSRIMILSGQDAGHNGVVILSGVSLTLSNRNYVTVDGEGSDGSTQHIRV